VKFFLQDGQAKNKIRISQQNLPISFDGTTITNVGTVTTIM
jgi:hypothetical protein